MTAYEREVGQVIMPSKRAKVALKIRVHSSIEPTLQLIRGLSKCWPDEARMIAARSYLAMTPRSIYEKQGDGSLSDSGWI